MKSPNFQSTQWVGSSDKDMVMGEGKSDQHKPMNNFQGGFLLDL